MKNTKVASKSLKRFSEKGITLLEALISTAIVGIGFVAVFQLVNFSVNSTSSGALRVDILPSLIIFFTASSTSG